MSLDLLEMYYMASVILFMLALSQMKYTGIHIQAYRGKYDLNLIIPGIDGFRSLIL